MYNVDALVVFEIDFVNLFWIAVILSLGCEASALLVDVAPVLCVRNAEVCSMDWFGTISASQCAHNLDVSIVRSASSTAVSIRIDA